MKCGEINAEKTIFQCEIIGNNIEWENENENQIRLKWL